MRIEGSTVGLRATVGIEGSTVRIEGSTVRIKGSTVRIEGSTVRIEGSTVRIERCSEDWGSTRTIEQVYGED